MRPRSASRRLFQDDPEQQSNWSQKQVFPSFRLLNRCSSPEEKRFLDTILLEELGKMGNPGHITFEDPDAIIVLETVGQQAGLSSWSREDLQRYPLLRLD